jgi:hypothetical protein
MFVAFKDLQTEFFKIFAGQDLTRPFYVELLDEKIPVRYFKSSEDYSEEEREAYPVISIQDYQPTFNPKFHNDVFNYHVIGDNDGSLADIWRPHFFLDFKFDVGVASKEKLMYDLIRQKFLFKYGKKGVIWMSQYQDYKEAVDANKAVIGVDYSIIPAEIERSDGIFETNYEFTVSAWFNAGSVDAVQMVEELNVTLIQEYGSGN